MAVAICSNLAEARLNSEPIEDFCKHSRSSIRRNNFSPSFAKQPTNLCDVSINGRYLHSELGIRLASLARPVLARNLSVAVEPYESYVRTMKRPHISQRFTGKSPTHYNTG